MFFHRLLLTITCAAIAVEASCTLTAELSSLLGSAHRVGVTAVSSGETGVLLWLSSWEITVRVTHNVTAKCCFSIPGEKTTTHGDVSKVVSVGQTVCCHPGRK